MVKLNFRFSVKKCATMYPESGEMFVFLVQALALIKLIKLNNQNPVIPKQTFNPAPNDGEKT